MQASSLRWRTVVGLLTATTIAVLWSVSVYEFGNSDHFEQLPIVLRVMDSHFLTSDFFVNATAGYGPRTGFAAIMAWLSSILSIPIAYFIVTVCCHVAVAIITYLAARDLLGSSDLGALLAVVLVLSARYSLLSGAPMLTRNSLVPAFLAMPFALSALWAGLRGRPFTAATLGLLGASVHSLVGIETAGLAIAASLVGILTQLLTDQDLAARRHQLRRAALRHLAAAAELVGIAYFALIRPAENILPTREFTEVVAFFRHPHHYVPSTFPLQEWAITAVVLALVAWSLTIRIREAREGSLLPWSIPALTAMLMFMLVGGYVFVEIWPSRPWVTAQTYRMLFLLNWLAMVLFADWVASRLKRSRSLGVRTIALIGLAGLGVMQSVVMLLAMGGAALAEDAEHRLSARGLRYGAIAAGIALPGAATIRSMDIASSCTLALSQWLLVLAFLGAAACAWPVFRIAIAAVLLWSSVFVSRSIHANPLVQPNLRTALLGTTSGYPDMDDMARFARDNTPPDAVFLVPREGAAMRLYGERAVVIEMKAFPFHDSAIREWKRRVDEVYGEVEYAEIDDRRIAELAEEFHADYVVLYVDTATGFEVLRANATYKLVTLSSRP